MKTNKLFYADTTLRAFSAVVVDCFESKKGFEIELDRTAFYPEGGGQAADKGTLNGIEVLHVHEDGERVLHLMEKPLTVGMEDLDAAQGTLVRGLSAALGVEGCLIQLDLEALLALKTIHNRCAKFPQTGVGVK